MFGDKSWTSKKSEIVRFLNHHVAIQRLSCRNIEVFNGRKQHQALQGQDKVGGLCHLFKVWKTSGTHQVLSGLQIGDCWLVAQFWLCVKTITGNVGKTYLFGGISVWVVCNAKTGLLWTQILVYTCEWTVGLVMGCFECNYCFLSYL